MRKVVHRKGIVKQVCRIAGKIGRSWNPNKRKLVSVKGIRPATWAPKAV